MKPAIPKELQAALKQAVHDSDVWRVLIDIVYELIADCECRIDFDNEEGPSLAIVREADLITTIPLADVEIYVEEAAEADYQIAAIDAFIQRLQEAKGKLNK
jgi:hypothetical protein